MPDRRRPIRRAYAGEDVRDLRSQKRGSASEIVASVAVYPGETGAAERPGAPLGHGTVTYSGSWQADRVMGHLVCDGALDLAAGWYTLRYESGTSWLVRLIDDDAGPNAPRRIASPVPPPAGMLERYPTGYDEWVATGLGLVQSFAPGDVILQQDEPATDAYLVQSGTVGIYQTDDRRIKGRVAVLGPGEFFGELGLLAATRRSADAVAEATTTCWRLRAVEVELLPAPLREELETRLHTWANANRRGRTAISRARAP